MNSNLQSWLYRVLANDEDGDPLDFGIINAPSIGDAEVMVIDRLSAIFEGPAEEPEQFHVRFYPIVPKQMLIMDAGIVKTAQPEDRALWA